MRIALLARRYDAHGGGTERDLIVTAGLLAHAGHAVTVYADEIRSPNADTSGRVTRVPVPQFGRAVRVASFAFAAPAAARRDRADLIVSFGRTIGADVIRSGGGAHALYLRNARRWKKRIVADAMWLSPYHLAQIIIERRAFAASNLKLVIAVSDLVRRDLISEFRLSPAQTVTLYNGVDLDRFTPAADSPTRNQVRAAIGLPSDAVAAIFVGNGFARKGLVFLLRAWPMLRTPAYLIVVGNDRAASRYQQLCRDLKIDRRVLFLGARPDVDRLFHAADVLAFPSLFEPFGNVVMEAMASGLPALTSEQSGVSELLPEQLRAFMVSNPADSIEIATRLDRLLETHPDLRPIARTTAEQHPWLRHAIELDRLLRSLPLRLVAGEG